jgi:Fic family protein
LQTDGRKSGPNETGASRKMVDLYKSYSKPLDQKRLFSWHQMMMNGRIDLEIVGGYRVHEDPMQIVLVRLDSPQVFYEAPPSHRVPKELENYLLWFNRAFSEGMPTLVHAGLSHLFFELIHPFEDGNGRIGRAIAEKVLAMGAKHPLITSLSSIIERNEKPYYQALERANGSLGVTDWLVYFSEEVLKAQINVQKLILFTVKKAHYFEDFRNKLNERQSKVALRLFLKKSGKLRHTRYYLPMVEILH